MSETIDFPTGEVTREDVREFRKTATVRAGPAARGGIIPTLEGDHTFEAGDYIAGPGAAGEFWPIRRDIFERTYAPMVEGGLLSRQIDEFMAWLFRDGGAEPPRREYDLVDQRLRTFLLSAAYQIDVDRLETALTDMARKMMANGVTQLNPAMLARAAVTEYRSGGDAPGTDRRLADALLHWYDKTHGNNFGHDHHCPVPWTDNPHLDKPDDRCTCGWSDVLRAEEARNG